MDKFNENGFSTNPGEGFVQETFTAADGPFVDFMGGKFDHPTDQSSNHSSLKAFQMFDQDEAGADAISYNNKAPAYTPERPGKFFTPDEK